MNDKTKKILGIVVNVIVAIILVIVLFVTVNIILSGNKGYTSFFGTAFVTVESDSMDGDKAESFSKGTLISIKILSSEEKKNLKEGDVITFYDVKDGERILNTHRIVDVTTQDGVVYYTTQGDNPKYGVDDTLRTDSSVIGLYKGQIPVIGSVISFTHTSTGFFVCIVLPSFLVVAYFAFNLYLTIRENRAAQAEATKEEEKEKMRQELLKELKAEGKISEEK
jgi:signal peptidase